jgi:hypothetical protein
MRVLVPSSDFCLLEKQRAQDFYASFCARYFDPVKNPFNIECVFDGKLTVLMIGCAEGQLARVLQ